jgi:hypothetical protein
MGASDSHSFRYDSYVRMRHFVCRSTYVPFRRLLGDVRREFMQRLSAALHCTLGFYLRDALHEGNVNVVACLLVFFAKACASFALCYFLLGGFECLFLRLFVTVKYRQNIISLSIVYYTCKCRVPVGVVPV